MYVPAFNAMTEPQVAAFLQAYPAGQLVTVGADGRPDATLVPVLHDGTRVLAHLARSNEHWRRIVNGSEALVVVSGADAYVSPGWYATKAEHGRVVPTWNYSAVHLRGTVTVHDDPDWVLDVVTRLTDRHETPRATPWSVDDAPAKYVRGRLRAIIGIEIRVDTVEGKAKLSQNRSAGDRLGALEGLLGEPDAAANAVGAAMRDALSAPAADPVDPA